ncbi:hypothetical protein DF286_05235 [Sphingosinicella humi]|uniref:Phytase-like domain-containing protein n=2 Tax=Allosphingosinicella humi TaxID=2068657 RepID=A0A2U2J226_9SPHN|nr:hypothetical protein DF286_05235 [Sphingosinicella humi]
MRLLLALASLPLLTTFAPFALYEEPPVPPVASIRFQPVPLDESDPARRRVGTLQFLGGWAIGSDDPRFGGISAMHVEAGEVVALSDAGSIIRFTLPGQEPARLTIRRLMDGPGSAASKFDRDMEAMTVYGGHVWVGFEWRNAVWRYRRESWRSDGAARPRAMRDWPSNSGAEAIVRLADGRFLIFSEGEGRRDGSTEVLLFDGDPVRAGTREVALGYRAPNGYRITDAALLPDGRLLLLNRRFSIFEGMSAKLVIADPSGAKAGSVLTGAEIAHFEAPLTVDNMEALSVTREGGRTIVWIASDDNFSAVQRTLLLKFALAEDTTKAPQP